MPFLGAVRLCCFILLLLLLPPLLLSVPILILADGWLAGWLEAHFVSVDTSSGDGDETTPAKTTTTTRCGSSEQEESKLTAHTKGRESLFLSEGQNLNGL